MRPSTPSSSYRRTHLCPVALETPLALVAVATDQPSSRTRVTSTSRPYGLRRGLGCMRELSCDLDVGLPDRRWRALYLSTRSVGTTASPGFVPPGGLLHRSCLVGGDHAAV